MTNQVQTTKYNAFGLYSALGGSISKSLTDLGVSSNLVDERAKEIIKNAFISATDSALLNDPKMISATKTTGVMVGTIVAGVGTLALAKHAYLHDLVQTFTSAAAAIVGGLTAIASKRSLNAAIKEQKEKIIASTSQVLADGSFDPAAPEHKMAYCQAREEIGRSLAIMSPQPAPV